MWKHLLNLFFPKSCAGCESFLLSNEKVICTQCRHEIPLTNHHKIEENEIFQKYSDTRDPQDILFLKIALILDREGLLDFKKMDALLEEPNIQN